MKAAQNLKHKLWSYWWIVATFIKFLKYYHYKQRQKVTWRIAMDAWFTFSMIAIVVTFQSYFIIVQLNCGTTWEIASLSEIWNQIKNEASQLFHDHDSNDTVSSNITIAAPRNKTKKFTLFLNFNDIHDDTGQKTKPEGFVLVDQCLNQQHFLTLFDSYQLRTNLQCINPYFVENSKPINSTAKSSHRRRKDSALDAYYDCVIEQEARFLSSVLFVLSICISMQFVVAATRSSIENFLTQLGKKDRIRYFQMRHEIVQLFQSKHIWELHNYQNGILLALCTNSLKNIYVPKDVFNVIIQFVLEDVETFDQDSDCSSRSSILSNIIPYAYQIQQTINQQTQTGNGVSPITRARVRAHIIRNHNAQLQRLHIFDDLSSSTNFSNNNNDNDDDDTSTTGQIQNMIRDGRINASHIGLDSSSELELANQHRNHQNQHNENNNNNDNSNNNNNHNNEQIEEEIITGTDDDEIISRLIENESESGLNGMAEDRISVSFSRLLNKIEKKKRKQWFIFLANCFVIAELAFIFAICGFFIGIFSLSTDWIFGIANLLTWLVGVIGTAIVLMRSQDLH